MGRRVAWVDGANSAVMGKIALALNPETILVHNDLGDSTDADSHRFIDDLEKWYGKEILRIKSAEYDNIDEVFEKRRYLAGINGAPCTGEMKVVPRLNWQLPSDTHLWGYTADSSDAARFDRMKENFPLLRQESPLIELGLTKLMTHSILSAEGVRRPRVYDMGFPNGNCIGCVKASSPNYWSLIRSAFPEVFERRADQSRRFGARLTRIKGKRIFIDEVPEDWPTTVKNADYGGCGFLCESTA